MEIIIEFYQFLSINSDPSGLLPVIIDYYQLVSPAID
jgi:hypothetical protein